MPARVVSEKEFRRKHPVLLAAAFGLVFVVAIWCVYFWRLTQLAEERLEMVQQRVGELQRIEAQLRGPETQIQQLEEKIGRLHELIRDKARWAGIVDEIYSLLPEGVWLTSILPMTEAPVAVVEEQPVARRRGAAAPVDAAPVQPGSIRRIEISGLGYTDKVPSAQPIYDLRDALRRSPFFTEQTEIDRLPPVPANTYVREFRVMIQLAEPLKL
jgi:Tfp pilus assembly protein PilN